MYSNLNELSCAGADELAARESTGPEGERPAIFGYSSSRGSAAVCKNERPWTVCICTSTFRRRETSVRDPEAAVPTAAECFGASRAILMQSGLGCTKTHFTRSIGISDDRHPRFLCALLSSERTFLASLFT